VKEGCKKGYDRLGQTSQAQSLDYLKQFFLWTSRMEFVAVDPSRFLEPIPKNKECIRPLTSQRFKDLLKAVDPFTSASAGKVHGWAAELKALFLFQRWAGLRVLDCRLFPRTGLVGNRISLITKKTGAKIENRSIPDHVAEALLALSPDRIRWRRDFFFWPEGRKKEGLTSLFGDIIGALNAFLAFTDDNGTPMRFHSHQLRDTYAVELLLAGVLLEDVSKLLTHSSIQTTERHYAPWVKSRLQQLEDKSVEAMLRMGVKVGGI